MTEIPQSWRDLEQMRLLSRWLAVRCPNGTRRKTDHPLKYPPQLWPQQKLWRKRAKA